MKEKTIQKCKQVINLIPTTSRSLRNICKECEVNYSTFLEFINANAENSASYARAKEKQADAIFDEIIEISEHTDEDHTPFTGSNVVQRDRLRIDARKWVASKLAPKKYGERFNLEHSGEIKLPDLSNVNTDTLNALLKEAGLKND